MTWTNLLANKEAQKHKTSKKELDNMRALIARDLADASEATIRVPSIDFGFKTDPLETSHCDFAVMGSEGNGKYYVS